MLRSRLLELKTAEEQAKRSEAKRSQVGTGERSEKIRTYNFKENRVTDHRINFTMHRLPAVLEGDLEELIDKAAVFFEAERMREAGEEPEVA